MPLNAILDLVLFAASLITAWVLDWKATDLVWGLWLSSITVGYIMLILGPFIGKTTWTILSKKEFWKGVYEACHSVPSKNTVIGLGIVLLIGLFLFAFFTFHFGMFHFIHGSFLSDFFPIPGVVYPKSAFQLPSYIFLLLKSYWPFVLASAISQINRIDPSPTDQPKPKDAMWGPYKSVIRMHFLIFVFAGLKALHAHNFIFYAAILFAYFFPWQTLRTKSSLKTS